MDGFFLHCFAAVLKSVLLFECPGERLFRVDAHDHAFSMGCCEWWQRRLPVLWVMHLNVTKTKVGQMDVVFRFFVRLASGLDELWRSSSSDGDLIMIRQQKFVKLQATWLLCLTILKGRLEICPISFIFKIKHRHVDLPRKQCSWWQECRTWFDQVSFLSLGHHMWITWVRITCECDGNQEAWSFQPRTPPGYILWPLFSTSHFVLLGCSMSWRVAGHALRLESSVSSSINAGN